MAERPKHWIKLWVSWLTTPAHLELSEGAFGLGPLLLLLATWDGEYDSGGWLLGEDGSPMSREAMARATHRDRKRLDAHLAELVRCKTLAIREDGALGFPRFGHWQETASATRTRRYRSRHSDAACDVNSDAQTGDGRRETAELAPQATPPTPSRGVSSESRVEAAFLSHPAPEPTPPKGVPTKPRKPRDDYPDGLDRHLLGEIVLACRELGRRGPRVTEPTPGMIDDLRKLWAAERPTADDLTHVVRVRAAMDRAGEGYGELSWEHLCRPASFRRYRDRDQPTAGRSKPWTPSDFGEGTT